jgi:hypothetical protein
MPIYRFGSRYSRWDGTQQIGPLSADDLMQAMSDDLMQDGDVNRALQRLFRWGFQRPDGEQVPGLQALMQRLRERRQQKLEQYNLQSMLSDIAERIEQIIATEREGIARRLEETQAGQAEPGSDAASEPGDDRGKRETGEASTTSSAANQQGPSGQAGQAGEGSQSGNGESGEGTDPDLRKLLEAMAQRRLEQLDAVPKEPPGAIRALTDYDFMTP